MNYGEWNQQFHALLSDGGWLTSDFYSDWWSSFNRSSDIRKHRLATAMDKGQITFQYTQPRIGNTLPINTIGHTVIAEREGYDLYEYKTKDILQRLFFIKQYLNGDVHDGTRFWVRVLIDAKSFLTWLTETFPEEVPDTTPVPIPKEPLFLSKPLQIALNCSKDLYPEPPTLSPEYNADEYRSHKKAIDDWLKKNNEGDNINKMLSKIINPAVKTPHKKQK